jgi:hypothetical protein
MLQLCFSLPSRALPLSEARNQAHVSRSETAEMNLHARHILGQDEDDRWWADMESMPE